MADIPILLMAAGGSSRMGSPKPLLKWGAHTLIEHQIRKLIKTGQSVIVILGHRAEQVMSVIKDYPVKILINKDWEHGMGNTIGFGIKQTGHMFPDATGVLITLVDQPFVSHHHLTKMLNLFHPGSGQILVSRAESGRQGVPVLFDQIYFESLQTLTGDEGAKVILREHQQEVHSVPCNKSLDDMDTREDYLRLRKLNPVIQQP